MAGVISQRQLVADIEDSTIYLRDFPILEKNENFQSLWVSFSNKVAAHYDKAENPEEFLSSWNVFRVEVDSRQKSFYEPELLTVPRELMSMWQSFDLSFVFPYLHYTETDFLEYLNRVLAPKRTNLWEDFADTFETLMDDYVSDHIDDLASIRNVSKDSDPQVINLTARMLGFNFRDEILEAVGKDRIAAIIPMIGEFYTVANTDDFIRLIELTVGANVLLEHLYTNDYVNFKTFEQMSQKKGKLLDENSKGKDWFKTTHINIYVEYGNAKYLATKIAAPLSDTLIEIIEQFIPANLVLKNFGLRYTLNSPETAPNVFFSGARGNNQIVLPVGSYKDKPAPLVMHDLPIDRLIFETNEEALEYINKLTNASSTDIFHNWPRFAGNDFYSQGMAPDGDARAWAFDESTESFHCTEDTSSATGMVSLARTKSFTLEATLSSDNTDDDIIGLVAAFDYLYYTVRAVHFTRRNQEKASWQLQVQNGSKVSSLIDGSSQITKGFDNAIGLKGWKASGSTRVKIERDGDIIRGWTSPFGSDIIDPSTLIEYNLRNNASTAVLTSQRFYGYMAHSQNGATFTNIIQSGEFEGQEIFALDSGNRFYYDINDDRWEYEYFPFKKVALPMQTYRNPITWTYFSSDSKLNLRRLTPRY